MESTFRRMTKSAERRDAYLRAEVVTALAHQIRSIRGQRGWTQAELAERMSTSQAVISRLEDPSYGRYSLVTLFDLARAFDVGLEVRFESFVGMLQKTWRPNAEARNVPSFEEEASTVDFHSA